MTDQKLLPPPNARNQGPKRRRRGFLWIIVLIIVGGIVWLVVQHAGSQAKKPDHHASAPVVLATAAKGDIAITRRELGTVTPPANVTVRTQIAGQLLEIGFTEGQIVHAGDFLAQIDPRPYQMTLEQAQGALTRDQALLRDAELNLNRYRTLLRQDSVSAQQLTTQQSLVGQYQGDVQTDQGQIDAAKLNLIYCHIVAPITGRVGLRPVDAGNYVQTSDTNGIVQLTQLQPISVIFTLPEDDLPAVMKRLATGAQLQTTAYDRTQTNQLATGQLQSVDNQIDVSTGTVKLRAEFANEDNALFPQSVRQYRPADRYTARRGAGTDRRHSARLARHFRLSGQSGRAYGFDQGRHAGPGAGR